MRLRIGVGLAIVVVAGGALAAGPWSRGIWPDALLTAGGSRPAGAADLAGRATLGPAERPVSLHLACEPAGPGLSARLTVPHFADLAEGFDFDGLAGPGGGTAPLTGILVSNAGSVRSVRMPASGAVSADPDASFTLTVAGAQRSDNPLRAVALATLQAGTRITWTQASPRAGDAALTATFTVAEADAAALKTALDGCLATPF